MSELKTVGFLLTEDQFKVLKSTQCLQSHDYGDTSVSFHFEHTRRDQHPELYKLTDSLMMFPNHHVTITGTAQDIRDFLKNFDAICYDTASPMLEQFAVAIVDRNTGCVINERLKERWKGRK